MSKYEMRITWDNEDEIFVAFVPQLEGCMSHGKTREEAIANAEDAIGAWIEVAQEFGHEVPEPITYDQIA